MISAHPESPGALDAADDRDAWFVEARDEERRSLRRLWLDAVERFRSETIDEEPAG